MPWSDMFSFRNRKPVFSVQRDSEGKSQILCDIYNSVEASNFEVSITHFNSSYCLDTKHLLPPPSKPINMIYKSEKKGSEKIHHFCLSGDLEAAMEVICNHKLTTMETLNDLCEKARINVVYVTPKTPAEASSNQLPNC